MLKRIIGTIPAAGVAFSALALVACSGGGNGGNGGDDEASARMDRMDQGASVMLAAFSDDPASSGSAQKDKPKPSKEPAKTDKPTPAKKGKSGSLGSSRESSRPAQSGTGNATGNIAQARGGQDTAQDTGVMHVVAEPASLELGEIPTNESKSGKVYLMNQGEQAVRLLNCKSTCGCTAARCPKGTLINPGDSVEIEINMRGGRTTKEINKKVTFYFDGQPNVDVPVHGSAVAFVEAKPLVLNPQKTPEGGEITLTSIDGVPFKVLRMHPPIMTAFPEEPQSEVKLALDWERWEELGGSRKAQFYLDHPKASRVLVTILKPRTANNSAANQALNRNTSPT